jgi:hypothetical protein
MNKTKKRISDLEQDLFEFKRCVWKTIDEIKNKMEKELKEPRCYRDGDAMPRDSHLLRFGSVLWALLDYLGVEHYRTMEDDPCYDVPKPIQTEVYKIRKKK